VVSSSGLAVSHCEQLVVPLSAIELAGVVALQLHDGDAALLPLAFTNLH
jgi:hypothetical protein